MTGGSGIVFANVTNVAIACTAIPGTTYSVSGSLNNVAGTGFGLRLNNQAADANYNVLPAPGATTYAFAAGLQMGSPFAVNVAGQPSSPIQLCVAATPAVGTN